MPSSNIDKRSLKPLLAKVGLRPIRFHDLRHTCAPLMLSQGVNPKFAQERLGHATISTTIQKYKTTSAAVSSSANRQRHATAKVGQRLRHPPTHSSTDRSPRRPTADQAARTKWSARSPFESNAGATPARVRTLPPCPLRSSSLDRKDARQDARAEARCRHPSVRRPEVAGYRCGLPGRSR